jgi:glycine hydroxymethyltransferase
VESTTVERRIVFAGRLGSQSLSRREPPVLAAADPELAAFIDAEERRQATELCLIPSENHVSPAVLAALGSRLTDKYSEGYPGKRYYEGNAVIDHVEALTIDRAQRLFGAEHANVQPLSGAPANLAVYVAFLEPGDTVMGLGLPAGGHLTHGWGVSVTGRWFRSVAYGVRRDTGVVDLDEVRELARAERPKLIWCGGTAIPRTIDFAGFAEIAAEVGAVLAADVAHLAGLIAGGAHPSPIGHADVVTTTTHKSLRGPRGAMILTGAEHAKAVDRAVFPGLQGGPHDNAIAAIAVALHEAAQPPFREYAHQIVANAKALADGLLARGFDLVSGGTDNHLLLVDLTAKGVTGGPAAEALAAAGLVCNRNAIPFDPRKPLDPSGIRLGTPAVTTRGMREPEMDAIAGWIDAGVEAARTEDQAALQALRREVSELAAAFPLSIPKLH